MRKLIGIFLFTLIFLPVFVYAECKDDDFSVIYINGIFTEYRDAKKDLDRLEYEYKNKNSINNVQFITGYNSTHLAGIGDIVKAIMQTYRGGEVDYDLTNILRQVHNELSTRKVLLVGHSQGTFYTNAAYDYLVKNGVSKESVSVYNIATPADKVAGGGNYLTSSTDKLIDEVVRGLIKIGSARLPLPANITIPLSEEEKNKPLGGHSLSGVYLAVAPDRIIGDMQKSLKNLSANEEPSINNGCFLAPKADLAHKFKDIGFWIGDKTVNAPVAVYKKTVEVVKIAYNFGKELVFGLSKILAKTGLFGAALTQAPKTSVESSQQPPPTDILKDNTQLIVETTSEVETTSDVVQIESEQDLIDEILEQVDFLKRQIADLEAAENLKNQSQNNQISQNTDEDEQEEEIVLTSTAPSNYYNLGGATAKAYPKILISEIQLEGAADSKEEFVELYNQNDFDVDLTDWYLHRKTKTGSDYSTYAANTLFSGRKITAKGYFLIARIGYFNNLADITVDNPLTEGNSLVLKNPNGDIVDKIGWGQAQDYETAPTENHSTGQSIGRKTDQPDTDNNINDFEIDSPTPRAQNVSYVAPPPPPPPPPLPPPEVYKILINEIQIDNVEGAGGANDDWVELYNPNDVDVSLSGWSIQKHSSDDPCSADKSFYKKNFGDDAIILAKGFYLIADTDANDLLKNMADMTASWSLSDDNTIYLARSKDKIKANSDLNIADKVGFGDKSCFSETNPALNPPEAKSIERKKLGLDTDNNIDDFKISDEPTPKGAFPKTTIQDDSDYSNNLAIGAPGSLTYNLLLKWQSQSPNLDFYQVQYKLNDGAFTDWLANTIKIQDNFWGAYSLFKDNVYIFRARAQDKEGNLGSWSKELKIDLTAPVVINEVAFAGTNADSNDQWIELYNRTDKDIDLTGWKIISDALILELNGNIPAKGYFILERNDDESLSDISASQIFSEPLGKNYLYLRDKNNRYIDEFFSSGLNEIIFIKDENRHSMERISPYSFGIFDKNWKLNNSNIINGLDRSGGQIYGAPGKQNSVFQQYTYYDLSFIEDTTLKEELSPYLFNKDVQIFKDITLSIEPGVVIKFYNNKSQITVNGAIKAIGRSDLPIIFTSFYDDDYGGDANADGNLSSPSPGDWLSLYFSKESKNSQLEYVNVKYGGATIGFSPELWGNALWADQSSISLKNSVLENNKNRGLVLDNSNSIIDSVKFLNESTAVDIKGGSPIVKNSHFEGNSNGINISSFFDGASSIPAIPLIENNIFTNNFTPILFGPLSYPSFSGNKASNNFFDAISFESDISRDMVLRQDLPYLVRTIAVVPEGITLTLEPGVIMKFRGDFTGLQINGTLNAVGAEDKPIIFEPYNADTSGVWMGLNFEKTSKNSLLENISISYGGHLFGANSTFGAALKIDRSSVLLKNSLIQKNSNKGVWLVNSPSVIDSVKFLEHGAEASKAVYVEGGTPEIKNSFFKDNYYGIYIDNWHNNETDEDIVGAPVLDNNQFESNREDIRYHNP